MSSSPACHSVSHFWQLVSSEFKEGSETSCWKGGGNGKGAQKGRKEPPADGIVYTPDWPIAGLLRVQRGQLHPPADGNRVRERAEAGIVLPLAACALLKEGRIVYTSSWPSALSACALLLPSPTSACPACCLRPAMLLRPPHHAAPGHPALCVCVCVCGSRQSAFPGAFPGALPLVAFPGALPVQACRSRTLWRASINEFLIE